MGLPNVHSSKHLSLHVDTSSVQSGIDKKVVDIFQSYIENCIESYPSCQETQLWDEVHKILYELLHDILNEICPFFFFVLICNEILL